MCFISTSLASCCFCFSKSNVAHLSVSKHLQLTRRFEMFTDESGLNEAKLLGNVCGTNQSLAFLRCKEAIESVICSVNSSFKLILKPWRCVNVADIWRESFLVEMTEDIWILGKIWHVCWTCLDAIFKTFHPHVS